MDFLIIALIVTIYFRIIYRIDQAEKFTDERIEQSEGWIFKSLYSISPKVVLPDQPDRKLKDIPATVIKQGGDGMDEFDGTRDDWHV